MERLVSRVGTDTSRRRERLVASTHQDQGEKRRLESLQAPAQNFADWNHPLAAPLPGRFHTGPR